jgi:hypothetical protein
VPDIWSQGRTRTSIERYCPDSKALTQTARALKICRTKNNVEKMILCSTVTLAEKRYMNKYPQNPKVYREYEKHAIIQVCVSHVKVFQIFAAMSRMVTRFL